MHSIQPLHDLIGYIAASLTTLAFVPQALKSWRSRDLSSISLGMYSLFTLGVGLWLIYGLLLGSWPIILANAITFALSGMMLGLKLQAIHTAPLASADKKTCFKSDRNKYHDRTQEVGRCLKAGIYKKQRIWI